MGVNHIASTAPTEIATPYGSSILKLWAAAVDWGKNA
jgi:hypothetical protein